MNSDHRPRLRESARFSLVAKHHHFGLRQKWKTCVRRPRPTVSPKQKTTRWVVFCFGGSGWIRTTEVSDNRFTVCPLWPLGNAPMLFHNAMYYIKRNAICQYLFEIFFGNFFIKFFKSKNSGKGRQKKAKVIKYH